MNDRDATSRHFVALGLGLFALTASIGTIKFLFNLHSSLEAPHVKTTELAAIAGLLLIATAFLASFNLFSNRRLLLFVSVITSFSIYFTAIILGATSQASVMSASICFTICFASSTFHFAKRRFAAGMRAGLVVVLMVAMAMVPSAISDKELSFHIFHIVAAIWNLAVTWYFITFKRSMTSQPQSV